MTQAHPESDQSGHEHLHVDHDHGEVVNEGSEHRHGPDHHHQHPSGLKGFVLSLLRPHSHDAADSVDSALEASTEGIRAVKISLVALGATAVVQLALVLISGSVALLADTIHNFSDALTAIPLWVAFVLSRRAANRRYTYGYGRAEDLAGVFIVAMIALSSMLAAYESIRRLINPQLISHAWVVVAAGLIGFAGNELVAIYRIRVGNKIGSAALVADGLHARTDGFTSLAVVAGAIGVWAGFARADAIAGLVISVAIIAVLRVAVVEVFRRLMNGVDPKLVDRIEHAATHAPGVVSVHDVRVRWEGHRLQADLAVSVDPTLNVADAHQIAHGVEHELLHQISHLDGAAVHIEPDSPARDAAHSTQGHHHE